MELNLGLQITLIGMAIVFITLYVLAQVIRIPQFFFSPKAPQAEEQPQPPAESVGIPAAHLAAIAAAVSSLDPAYRVSAISVRGNENWEQSRYTEIASL